MKVKICGMLGAVLCLLSCVEASAQTRAAGSTRTYRATPTGYTSMSSMRYLGQGGCADCGVPASGPSCDACDGGCGAGGCGSCGGCDRCCVRVLPAIARGVGAVADFVGDTLDCIFCVPRANCCESSCCDRPRACVRPLPRRAWCGSCGGGGCTSCGGCGVDYGYESHPMVTPAEDAPTTPPTPAEARTYRTGPMKPTAHRHAATTAPKQNVASRRTSYTTQASATKAEPRELSISTAEAIELAPAREEQPVKRTSAKSAPRTAPSNPLRR